MNLYHISEKNLDNKILYPRIPDNYMTKNGYEDNKTPRVSFSKSIDGCLVALSANIKEKEFYIHMPIDDDIKIKNITSKDVPDANLTDEVWVLEPVKIKVTGKIKVLDSIDEPLIYKYGNTQASLYKWEWKNISLTESVEDVINYYNGYKQGIYEYIKEFEDERIKILKETKDNNIIESLGWIPGVPVNSNNILRVESLNKNNIKYIKESDLTQEEVINNENIEDIYDKESIGESYIFSKKDLYINFDKFESGKSNILLITGLSGSGKSTISKSLSSKYKAQAIELDIFEHGRNWSDNNIIKAGEVFSIYFLEKRKDLRSKGISTREEFVMEFNKFFNFVLNYCRTHKDKNFIIEGVQIFSLIEPNKIKGIPIILINASMTKSMIQYIKRDIEDKDMDWKSQIKNHYPKLLSWYLDNETAYNSFKKSILKEEYIEDLYDIYNINEGSSQKIIIKKGTHLQRLTLNKNENNNNRHVYVSKTKNDNDKYLVEWGNRGYKVTLEVTNDLIIPTYKERFSAFIRAIEKADINRVAKDISELRYRNDDEKFLEEWVNRNTKAMSKESYISFISSLINSDYNRQIYFKELKKYGYNATIDDNDAAEWTDRPIIIFERNKNIKQIEYVKIDSQMVDDAKKRLNGESIREEYIEEKLSYKEREKLKDSDFGLPKLRKYPLHDEAHIRTAIKFFNYVDKKYEKELATNIIRRMKELNLYDIEIGKENRFYKYYQESIEPEKIKEDFEYIIEEANKRNEEPIYILLTKTGSTMSKAISTVLGDFYTHVSISFDLNMNKIYAFDKQGFIIEELQKTYKDQFGNIPMAIYCMFVNKNSLQTIKNKIEDMLKEKKKYHYNYLGALGLAFDKPVHINNAMFCSEFVDQLLKLSGNDITGKNSGLVTPQDFKINKSVYKIYEGTLNKYSVTRAQKNLSKLRSRIFTELGISYINEMLNITKDDRNDWHTYASEPIGGLYNFGPCDQGLHNYLKISIKPNLVVRDDEIVAPHDIRYGDELTLSEDDMEYIVKKMHGAINKALPVDHPDNKHPNYNKSDLSEYLDESYIEESKNSNIVYYGLTEDEVKDKQVSYKKNNKYNGKAVNLSKEGLIKFLMNNNMQDDIKYYTRISLSKFKVIKDIDYDKEYDMVVIETPFTFIFEDAYKINYSIKEAKEFPVQFDKDGSLIIRNIKKLDFEEEYQKSHKLLLSYEKTNNYEGMKYELSKLWYMNIELERRIYNSNRDESKLNEYTRVRARILNDFNKYIKVVNKVEIDFNFSEYYEESPFNDGSMKLRKSTLEYLAHYLKQIVKSILI